MRPLRIAIVGAGLMGRWHAFYAARAGAEVAAIVDPRPDAAARLWRRYPRAGIFPGLTECLRSCHLDAAHVCTPPETSVELVEAALLERAHVLVEKPLATSVAQTRALIDLARRSDRKLIPVHQFPFQRGFRRLCRRRARLGNLVRIVYRAWSAGGEGRDAMARREVLRQFQPHPCSLLCALLGDAVETMTPLQVITFTADELELTASQGSTQVRVEISLRARPPRNELVVVGDRGSAVVDLFHGYCCEEKGSPSRAAKLLRPFRCARGLLWRAGENLLHRCFTRQPAYPGLRDLIETSYRSIRTNSPPPITEREMLMAAEWAEQLSRRTIGPSSISCSIRSFVA